MLTRQGSMIRHALLALLILPAVARAGPAPPDTRGTARYEMRATGWVDGVLIEPIVREIEPDLMGLLIMAPATREVVKDREWEVIGNGPGPETLLTFRLRIWYGPARKGK